MPLEKEQVRCFEYSFLQHYC